MALPETQQEAAETLPDAWDYKGRAALKSSSGGWTSAAMILGVEACERLTTLGIAVNLVTYLTGTMLVLHFFFVLAFQSSLVLVITLEDTR